MVLSKTPFPSEGEFIIGKVTDIQDQYVYVELLDYEGLPSEQLARGMIHISEISSRWIRNIRNFVRVGQRLVLRVLRVDETKGHIDLSLRRVNSAQKKNRMKEWKYALKYENLLQFFADETNKSLKDVYDDFGFAALGLMKNEYQDTVEEFKENGEELFKKIKGIPKDHQEIFLKIVDENVSISTVSIIGKIKLYFTESDGIEHIKKTLRDSIDAVKNQRPTRKLMISYIGAPFYRIEVISKDYLDAENMLSDALEVIEDRAKNSNGVFEFIRD